MKWFARISLVAAATVLLATDLPAQRRFNPRTVIPRPFPALTEFPVVSAKKAEGRLNDAELVLGV